ncbi:DNA N-6-adenine-methyltransferase [Blastococcus deserti]|uniref:DNA N-6-adenine-methyltransferase n=1 Tax=Blastococcus deserti TaxID=2259033 RepID=A0ABW4X5Y3_9ACTN
MTATGTTTSTFSSVLFSSKSDNWPTPQDTYDPLHAEFGFVVDACASATNRKVEAYYGLDHTDPARRDGLAGDWAADAARLGGAVWMNPPYGRRITDMWVAKAAAAAAGATVVCLVPSRTGTKWFHDLVLANGAEVRFVKGRLKFGDATNSAPFDSLIVVFRPPTDSATTEEATAPAAVRAPLPAQATAGASAPRRHQDRAARGIDSTTTSPSPSTAARTVGPRDAAPHQPTVPTSQPGRGPGAVPDPRPEDASPAKEAATSPTGPAATAPHAGRERPLPGTVRATAAGSAPGVPEPAGGPQRDASPATRGRMTLSPFRPDVATSLHRRVGAGPNLRAGGHCNTARWAEASCLRSISTYVPRGAARRPAG